MPKLTGKPPTSVNVAVELARAQMSQAEMAAVLGVSPAGFSDRMHGRTHWRFAEVEAMAKFLGVSVDRFVDDSTSEQASA